MNPTQASQGQQAGINLGGNTNSEGLAVWYDATNISITWTKTYSPTGTVNMMWEAEA